MWAVLATILILTLTFGLLVSSPNPETGYIAFEAAQEGHDPLEAIELHEQQRGEDRPITDQYLNYMIGMATLNWGTSFTYNTDVILVISQAWIYSAMIVIPATILAVFFGFVIGIYSAMNQYSKTDYAATFFAFFGISLPNFWFAIVLILVFGVFLGWFPITYNTDNPMFSIANAVNIVLPVIVLATAAIASEMRYARAEALEYVRAEFVKTARAKGASESRVMIRHVFRPAMVPLITILIGDLVGIIFATAYIVEVIFGIPGLGLVSYNALIRQDTPLVLATTLLPVFVAILGNLLQDIAYTMLDPRIKYRSREVA